jgi:hypothetical protein
MFASFHPTASKKSTRRIVIQEYDARAPTNGDVSALARLAMNTHRSMCRLLMRICGPNMSKFRVMASVNERV